MDPPRRMREITPEWLTYVLRESGALRGGRVDGFELDPIGNFSNQLWRIHLSYAGGEADAPATVVLKRLRRDRPGDAGQRLADEIRFYSELGAELPVRAPRLHYGVIDPDNALMVMEHVEGIAPIDFWQGASLEHSRLAMKELARLHARFIGRVAKYDWIPAFADASYLKRLSKSYAEEWSAKRDFFAEMTPDFVEIGDALVGRMEPSLVRLGEPQTLLHGDAHLENLAPIERDGAPGILFHDWAGVRRGSASFDVAVFVVMSFPPERRPQVERQLVELHAEALRAAGAEHPSDPWEGYRLGVLAWAVRLVHFMRPFLAGATPEVGPGQMILERCAAAPVELRVGDLIA